MLLPLGHSSEYLTTQIPFDFTYQTSLLHSSTSECMGDLKEMSRAARIMASEHKNGHCTAPYWHMAVSKETFSTTFFYSAIPWQGGFRVNNCFAFLWEQNLLAQKKDCQTNSPSTLTASGTKFCSPFISMYRWVMNPECSDYLRGPAQKK